MEKITILSIQAELRALPVTRKVENPSVGLLRLLNVHDRIQVWSARDGRVRVLRWTDSDIEDVFAEARRPMPVLYATPRAVLCEALNKSHYDSSELRRRLISIGINDWNSAAGYEYDYYVMHGRWDQPGKHDSRHHHYLPELKTPNEVGPI